MPGFLKLEHTLFSLPLFFAGSLLAQGGWPSWRVLGLVLVAGTGGRTLALALNRLIDRHIDAKNPRTANRELVTGALISLTPFLSAFWAWRFICGRRRRSIGFVCCGVGFLFCCLWFTPC
jgi:heme O synthase-like polyprenyltransferase